MTEFDKWNKICVNVSYKVYVSCFTFLTFNSTSVVTLQVYLNAFLSGMENEAYLNNKHKFISHPTVKAVIIHYAEQLFN